MQLSLLEQIPGPEPTTPATGGSLTRKDLVPFLPEPAVDYIEHWFINHPVRLRIASPRSSKFGDYRPAFKGMAAVISVNGNLNRYDFLITLVHEMAHDDVMGREIEEKGIFFFKRRKDRPAPHGKEWKLKYHELMKPLMVPEVFPEEILAPLRDYFTKPGSSAKAGHELATALKKHDEPDGKVFLRDLPPGAVFYLPGGRAFRKKEQLRKRFRCQSLDNRRLYLFSPVAAVFACKP